jgi:pimeloyl-ACP methyl ester carboxylesterase
MTNPFLPADTVRTELVEFAHGSRAVQGVVFHPATERRTGDTAAIFVHGVENFWFLGPTMFLAPALADRGITTLGYNGVHSGLTFRQSTFEDAVDEVDSAIGFMKARGFSRIALFGHSLGTPIIERYAGTKPDSALAGIAVMGPHDNLPGVTRRSLLGPQLYETFRAECRTLVAEGRGQELRLLPYRSGRTIITSAKTFLSYRDVDGSKADVRDVLPNITAPMLIAYDPKDNIHGLGETTMRAEIVRSIKEKAAQRAAYRHRRAAVDRRRHRGSGTFFRRQRNEGHRPSAEVVVRYSALDAHHRSRTARRPRQVNRGSMARAAIRRGGTACLA